MKKKTLLSEVLQMQKIAGLLHEEEDFNLSDAPKFNVPLYYIHDEEGLEEPLGPFTIDQAKQELTKYGTGWKLVDAETAGELWSHLDLEEDSNKQSKDQYTKEVKLKKLVDQKDALVLQLKSGQIGLDQYKLAISNIPAQIKKLRGDLEKATEPEIDPKQVQQQVTNKDTHEPTSSYK